MDCIVQPQSHLWTGTIPHGLPSYHQRSFFPNFYFPRKRSFSTSFYPGPSMFFLHDDNDVDYPTEVKGELAQTIPYHGMVDDNGEIKLCVVCGERASGFYFGALVCLPCKSFYIRCTKDGEPTFTCQCSGNCDIVKQGRIRCQYCRYQRCLMAGMCRKEKPETVQPAEGQVLCKVCGDIANGIHFGVNTCEGCKKFFRRGLVENQSYICKGEKDCGINPRNRNNCRYCRYQKCLSVGMSREAIKMGRPKKGDGSEGSCNITSSPKGIRQPLVDLETNQSTNPHLGEDSHDTLKKSSVSSDIKEESLRSSCDFEKKMSTNVWNQGQGQTSASPWQPCSQGHIVTQGNQGQSSTTVTSSEFIEEEMDEILMMLQNDNQSGGPAKKMRYEYNQMAIHKTCKSEFGNGVQGQQWGTNEIGNHGMSLNEPMNMTAGHINHVFPRPPPQYPGYISGFQQEQSMSVQTCMPGSPCHSPNSQSASPGGYISDSGLHSPGYVPNGSPARSPGCQYSPQHSPMYQHSPSPHSPYQSDASSAASPYHEPVYQNSPYSPQDGYQVTDLSANVNCGSQNMRLPRSPLHNSLQFNNQMTNLSNTSPTTTIPLQEGGVHSQDGWCLTGFPSLMCHSPSHNTTSNMTIPHQEGINRRSSSRLENLQKINSYFMSPTSCNLQLVPDSSHDGTMTRSDIEEEVVHKTLASVSPAESFYYVLSDNHSCSSDSNCSTNYDEFTSCQRLNKRKACDNADMYLRSEGSNIGRYQANLSRKYWQASVDREMTYPMTSERQTLLEHLSKIFQQMCDRYTGPAKQLANQDSHCWQQIQLRIVRNTSAGVKFASQIPGFSSLHPEDKAFLCKNVTFMSTLLMAGQHLYSPAEKNFRDFWNWQITPQNPFYPFKEQLVVMGEKIHALGMDVYEVSAMAALLFMASDFLDFAYPEAIEEGRRKIIGALKSYELSKGVDVQSRLTSLFSIAPEIRHVGMWHHELMKQMKINVQKQEVHQLFDAVNYRES